MRRLIIIGAGGHGKVCADIASKMNVWATICFLDDYIKENVSQYEVIGTVNPQLFLNEETDFFVAIGDNSIRKNILGILHRLDANVVNLIDTTAIINDNVIIDNGTVIMPGVIINSSTKIGFGVILNTGSIIEHDCIIGDYSHISPGVNIAGSVKIGAKTWLGIGSTVINNISVCESVVIGAQTLVTKDIIEKGTYVGIPARKQNYE